MVKSLQPWSWPLTLVAVLSAGACTDSSNPPQSTGGIQSSPSPISPPAVSLVLSGTDVIDIQEAAPLPFTTATVSGDYGAEQGGAVLSLIVRRQGDTVDLERQYQEPGMANRARRYQLQLITAAGACSSQQDVFVRQAAATGDVRSPIGGAPARPVRGSSPSGSAPRMPPRQR